MNTLDRLISYVAPQVGLRRERARVATSLVRFAYDAARTGRRNGDWIATGASANTEVGGSLARMRERSRSLIRDNHWAKRAKAVWRTKVVGPGIQPRSPNAKAMEVWYAVQSRLSADGRPHFGAIQRDVEGARWESGEVLIRRRMRRLSDGLPIPIQVQVIESDFLDTSRTIGLIDGGYILQGVEFDPTGQRRGYWLFGQHPGEVLNMGNRKGLGLVSNFVPAEDVIHYYVPERPGQVRGVPALHAVLSRIRDVDDYQDTELVRKRTESCVAVGVESPDTESGDGPHIGAVVTDSAGNTVEKFSPGMIVRTKPGETLKFNNPTYAGGYGEYIRVGALDISAGTDIPYCLLTQDYSQSNYSSSRVGLVSFGEEIEEYQWNSTIPILCQRVWDWVMEAAYLAGKLDSPSIPVEWDPPGFDLLDRESEAKADSLMLENGTLTWPQAVGRQGRDPERQMAECEKWKPRVDKAGIKYMTKVTAGGTNGTDSQTPG